MKFTRMIASIVGAVALSLGSYSSVARGSEGLSISETLANLAKWELAARTVEFTPEMFTALTGLAPDQGVLVVGPRLAGNTFQLELLLAVGGDWSSTPVVCGTATLVSRSAISDFDAEITVPQAGLDGSTAEIQITTIGVEATYEIVTFLGWTGTVRGARVMFTVTATEPPSSQSMVAFLPQDLVLDSPVGLPADFASFALLAEDIVDCDGLTPEECFELRKCFNAFNSCMKQADNVYSINHGVCNSFSRFLLWTSGGAATGVGLGACIGSVVPGLGTLLGVVAGGVYGGLACGLGSYFYCLQDARTQREIDYSRCRNELELCLENFLIMPL